MCRFALLAAVLLAAGLLGQVPPVKKAPAAKTALSAALLADLKSHRDLPYARYGDRELKLDLYRPASRGAPLPGIVCIHGGGWFKGERGSMTQLAQALAARGFVAVTISYRLSGEAKFPADVRHLGHGVSDQGGDAEKLGFSEPETEWGARHGN